MDFAYRYGDPGRLYLNVTNRCTNRCNFCVRCYCSGLGGSLLQGDEEPDLHALMNAIRDYGGIEDFDEFVWCGFGEPTFRLDLISAAADVLRSGGAKIRLNTNGHACLIHGRDVLPELSRAVDAVNVSLNAPSRQRYVELCRPDPGSVLTGERVMPEYFWDAMLDFLSRSPEFFREVQVSVVGLALSVADVAECRVLAHSLGLAQFRVR
jgi:TatD DNase family protein